MVVARLSLVRARRYRDPRADRGRHASGVGVRPGGIPEAIGDGSTQSLPLRPGPVAAPPLVGVGEPAGVIDTVKLADDRSGDVVVRLHEALGGRAPVRLRADFDWSAVAAVDLLERPVDAEGLEAAAPGSGVDLLVRPFELRTLRFRRAR